ncbi:divalent-cation tolerance protein cutA [Candidatus Vecturithrix granuli]|uniref:Divalent-cation tolerance protein cutA n=1 Tax=Vecturithrix granuli TaxID=1499967 RepID=A0A081CA30_VECG1|nr:divalent-cation tolerance protein cutA [Candidatus Vecturithrix granuli]
MTTEYILIFITTGSVQEAEMIARTLVEKKLAACGNIVPAIRSVFWWQGNLENEQEALLILKSRSVLLSDIITVVKALHSYDEPEIIAMPIFAGSESYLAWIEKETQQSS